MAERKASVERTLWETQVSTKPSNLTWVTSASPTLTLVYPSTSTLLDSIRPDISG